MVRALSKIVVFVGLATESACLQNPPQHPVVLEVIQNTGGGCRISMDGHTVGTDELSQIDAQSPERRGIVIFANKTPKTCIDRAVAQLKSAGIETVDVVAWHGAA